MSQEQVKKRQPYSRIEQAGLLMFCGLVVIYCAITLGSSLRHGRLSIVPIYDDVEYLIDGLKRLTTFEFDGVVGLVGSFMAQPPHAPYSTFLAVMGFVLTPHSMFGAYALDSIWLVVILVLVDRLLRGLPMLSRIGVLIAALAVPLLGVAITSFRPDPSWGLVTGIVAVMLATLDLGEVRPIAIFGMGLLVGAAALSKPTGMPAGAVVMATGYIGSALAGAAKRTVTLRDFLTKTFPLLLGVFTILAPYLVFAWNDLWIYISSVMGKQSDVWRTDGSMLFHIEYYIRPQLLSLMIGWILFGGPVFLAVASCLAMTPRHRSLAGSLIAVCAVVIVAYTIPTASPVKSGFIGCLFFGAVIAASLWMVGQSASLLALPSPLVFLAGLSVFAFAWIPSAKFDRVEGPAYTAMDAANKAIAPALIDLLSNVAQGHPPFRIYMSSPGPVFAATQEYMLLLNRISAIVSGDYTTPDWSAISERARASDVVIATQQGALGQGGGFSYPTIQYQDRLIDTFDGDKDWRRLTTYTDPEGFRTIVFTREPVPDRTRVSFDEGFRGLEGPYPDMKLPPVRWMTANKAGLRITLKDGAAPPSSLGLQCQSVSPTEVIVEDGAGKTLSSQSVDQRIGSGSFGRVRIPWSSDHRMDRFLVIASPTDVRPGDWPGPLLCANRLEEDG